MSVYVIYGTLLQLPMIERPPLLAIDTVETPDRGE